MYRLNLEQQAIVNRIQKVADKHILPSAERVDTDAVFPKEAVEILGQQGFLGLTVSAEFGGLGQGLRVSCAVVDEIAQRCSSTAMIFVMHLCGITCYSAMPKKTEVQLRAASQGRHLSTLAWSERGSRSHFWSPVSQAVTHDGQVRITAEKSWVTSAKQADGYVVSTRWSEGKTPTETMLYLVLGTDPGLSVSGPWDGLGMRGNASAPMHLKDVTVGSDRALCKDGKGFEMILEVVLPVFQLGIAAVSVGIAEGAVRATQSHLTSTGFDHLNSNLAELPNLRARLAQMRIETDRARAHLASVIDAVEDPSSLTQLLVLEAKAAASETAIKVTEIGMRACGGAAFSKHLGLERYFRDAQASFVMAPTTDHAYEFIGRALCGMELFG